MVVSFISLTRTVLLVLFYVLFSYTSYLDAIIEDPFHHYHAGLILLGSSYFMKKSMKRLTIQALATALIIEEHAVIVHDLGFSVPGYFYLNGVDLLVSFALTGLLYGLFRLVRYR